MKKFKNGDKVKIPTIGTACIRTSLEEIQKSLFDYKLDYLYVCDAWEDGEIGLMRGDGKVLEQDLYHENDLEHYEEYNETFNPEAHSHLIIDFDKVETIEEDPCITFAENYVKKYNGVGRDVLHIVVGIKSDAARNYWFKIFQEEQKTIKQLFEELDPLKRAELIQGYCDECGQNTTCYCKNDE